MEYLTKVELLFESDHNGEVSAIDLFEAISERFKEPLEFPIKNYCGELRLVEMGGAEMVVRKKTDATS